MMMVIMITEMKLRRQPNSFSEYSGSLDEGHYRKDKLGRSFSTIASKSVDNSDPSLTGSSPPMDCVDSVNDQQHTGSHDIQTTSLKLACQVSTL